MIDFSNAVWRKSSHSGGDYEQCVELASASGLVGVRDSKQRGHGPILTFSPQEMTAFLHSAKTGRFDRRRPLVPPPFPHGAGACDRSHEHRVSGGRVGDCAPSADEACVPAGDGVSR